MRQRSEIAVLGSLNMDFAAYVTRFPAPGETLAASSFIAAPGGKGGNQAVAAARLGSRVSMIGRVGVDELGRQLRTSLEADGVDCRFVVETPGASTGMANITVDAAGENTIVSHPGANAHWSAADVESALPLLEHTRFAILQLEMEADVREHVIRLVHATGTSIVLNLAPVVAVPPELFPLIDLLIVNEIEASQLTGMSVDAPETALEGVKRLRERGVRNVIITLGENGAVLLSSDSKEGEHIGSPRVRAVDTTAAGDCFVAAVTHYWNAAGDLREAVRNASVAAALAVTKRGAYPSLPAMKHVATFKKLIASEAGHGKTSKD